jgi:heat shock protein HslJ
MACNPQRTELENDFLYELNDYRNIVRDGDRLLMIGRDREVLTFAQRDIPQSKSGSK